LKRPLNVKFNRLKPIYKDFGIVFYGVFDVKTVSTKFLSKKLPREERSLGTQGPLFLYVYHYHFYTILPLLLCSTRRLRRWIRFLSLPVSHDFRRETLTEGKGQHEYSSQGFLCHEKLLIQLVKPILDTSFLYSVIMSDALINPQKDSLSQGKEKLCKIITWKGL